MIGFFFTTLLPILLGTIYVGLGARVMTYSVINRVPLKIAPNAGEWIMQSFYSFFAWPIGLMLTPELRPALKQMNRRERDRLQMKREVEYAKDSVAFAAERAVHNDLLDKLHAQQRQIEEAAVVKAIGSSKSDFDPPELREEEEDVEIVLGTDAQIMLHMAQYAADKQEYMAEWGIITDSFYERFYRLQGCHHKYVKGLVECQTCSPVFQPRLKGARA